MAPRNLGIIAYGTAQDREKLAQISTVEGKSGSELIIQWIRDRHRELLGDDHDER